MRNNDGDSQSDDPKNDDPIDRRPTKKKKKNLPVINSDREDSQI